MVKLEDLKFEDVVYMIHKYHWFMPITVETSMYHNDVFNSDIIVAKDFRGSKKYYGKDIEESLFRTEKEARDKMKELKDKQKEEWKDKDNLIEFLYGKAFDMLTDAECDLINEVIKNN